MRRQFGGELAEDGSERELHFWFVRQFHITFAGKSFRTHLKEVCSLLLSGDAFDAHPTLTGAIISWPTRNCPPAPRVNFADMMNKGELSLALRALGEMDMSDMLSTIDGVGPNDQNKLWAAASYPNPSLPSGGPVTAKRINFAFGVVLHREIKDFGLPLNEVNEGRKELGCTPLDDVGVQREIDMALHRPIPPDSKFDRWRLETCCGQVGYAWDGYLVGRREMPDQSLISNLAAAAHYMAARYAVCSGMATLSMMNINIAGYEDLKRAKIRAGDRELSSVALNKGSRPFPPDFAVANWAYKGAKEGESQRLRCNSKAPQNLIPPFELRGLWWAK